MIIDAHTHINNYHEDRVISLEDSLNTLTDSMLKQGGLCLSVIILQSKPTPS